MNERKQHLSDWISAVTSPYAPKLVFQHETETVFYGFFVGNDTLAIRYDAFGIKDNDGRLREAFLEVSSDEGLGGGGDITYRYSFDRKQFVGFGATIIDFPTLEKRFWPTITEEQILIPLKGIPFQTFDVQLALAAASHSSVRVRITLKPNEGAVEAEIRPSVFKAAPQSLVVDATAKLSEIERYLGLVFEARGPYFSLGISSPNGVIDANVDSFEGEVSASLWVQMGTDSEAALQDFFERHGLRTPTDSDKSGMLYPDLPVQQCYDILSVPLDRARLAGLLTECFREVNGLNDDSDLNFSYRSLPNGQEIEEH